MSETLRIFRFLAHTRAEGPGARACLWVQGCSLECPGCFNSHLWPGSGGTEVSVEALTEQVLAAEGIEGLTLLGGEPFEQAAPLASLAQRVRAAGLSVMTFSGYRIEELRKQGAAAAALLAATDLLIDGRYIATLPDPERPWVGSTNQRFHFLTDRYAHLEEGLDSVGDRLEVRLEPDGGVFVNGMADAQVISALRESIAGPAEARS